MAKIDWTQTLLAQLPQDCRGDPFGDCATHSKALAAQMRGAIMGQRVAQISRVDCYMGGSQSFSEESFCKESLRPWTLTNYRDPPSDAAVADRVNQRIIGFDFIFFSGQDDMLRQLRTALDAGYPALLLWAPNHEVPCWAYDDDVHDFGGWDSRATSPGIYALDYDMAFYSNTSPPGGVSGSIRIIKNVLFTETAIGDLPVTPVQRDGIQSAWNAQSWPALAAALAQIGIVTGGIVGPSDDAITVPPSTSVTDPTGGVWTLGSQSQYGKLVLRNGVSAQGGQGTTIALKSGQIKVQNSLGDWWLWNGSNWVMTTAP